MRVRPETIKDIKVFVADMGHDSMVLIDGKLLPCSSMQIVNRVEEVGKLLIEIPLPYVEVIGQQAKE